MTRNDNTAPTERPPKDALRVHAWKDMSTETGPAKFEIPKADGSTKIITLSKGNRIVLDALIRQPILCASEVRVSDRVSILRNTYGVPITKKMYENDSVTGRAKFGVYFADKGVRRIDGGAT
jgi:hypothetical protein